MKQECPNEIEINNVIYQKKCMSELSDDDYVIVRTYSAGVFAGELRERKGKEVRLTNARRIWKWSGAASLSQLAMEGTKNPNDCKFPCEVAEIILTEAIEVISCTKEAQKSIKGVPIWSA